MNLMNRRLKSLVLGATLSAWAVAGAFAQPQPEQAPNPDELLPPPQVREVGAPPTIWNFVLFGLLIAVAVGANCIPSKRGHQD